MQKTQPSSRLKGQNRDNIREHNLSLVLRLLHQSGTVARSLLTSVTGLNRSTISDLVAELGDLFLVTESEAVSQGVVGRPSYSVGPNTNVVAFAVNPEIDATTVAAVGLDGTLLHKIRHHTPHPPTAEEAVRIAAAEIENLKPLLPAKTKVAGIGAALPGQVRVADGVVRHAPHLGWVEASFGSMLNQLTGLPVAVDNDASLASLAERTYGSARGSLNSVCLFAGSGGIGGGVIINGSALRGSAGYGGELGHMVLTKSSATDFSGLKGTLEASVKRDDLLQVFGLSNATDEELRTLILEANDPKALKLLKQHGEYLGLAIANLANIFNPEIVVLAGFLDAIYCHNKARVLAVFQANSLNANQERLVIRSGELGSNATLIGASELAFAPLLAKPSDTKLYKL